MEHSFFAGLESYMEDEKVIDLSPEAQDAVDQAIDATEERADAEAEVTQIETQMKAQLAMLNQLAAMESYVKTYGVDRSFMRMFNSNGELAAFLKTGPFASCESFDIQGDPQSPESIAMCEALFYDSDTIAENFKALYLKWFSAGRRWIQSFLIDADKTKASLVVNAKNLSKAQFHGQVIKAVTPHELDTWIKYDSIKKRGLVKLGTDYVKKDITKDDLDFSHGQKIVADLRLAISDADDFDASYSTVAVDEFKGKLQNYVKWALKTCDDVTYWNKNYSGYFNMGFNAKIESHLIQHASTIARQCWALLNTSLKTDMKFCRSVDRVLRAVCDQNVK